MILVQIDHCGVIESSPVGLVFGPGVLEMSLQRLSKIEVIA